MCCVMPPASPATTFASRIASSSEVLPWSTWPITVTTGGRGASARRAFALAGRREELGLLEADVLDLEAVALRHPRGDLEVDRLVDRHHRAEAHELALELRRLRAELARELRHADRALDAHHAADGLRRLGARRSSSAAAPARRGDGAAGRRTCAGRASAGRPRRAARHLARDLLLLAQVHDLLELLAPAALAAVRQLGLRGGARRGPRRALARPRGSHDARLRGADGELLGRRSGATARGARPRARPRARARLGAGAGLGLGGAAPPAPPARARAPRAARRAVRLRRRITAAPLPRSRRASTVAPFRAPSFSRRSVAWSSSTAAIAFFSSIPSSRARSTNSSRSMPSSSAILYALTLVIRLRDAPLSPLRPSPRRSAAAAAAASARQRQRLPLPRRRRRRLPPPRAPPPPPSRARARRPAA